mgnify:CR=1 FL=1
MYYAPKHFAIALTLLLITCAITTVNTQSPTRYRGRLSIVPVDFSTVATISGSGEFTAEIQERELLLNVHFADLSSPATSAELRKAPKGQRGSIEFTFNIRTTRSTTGNFSHTLTLTEPQLQALREEQYYLQIQTVGNPDGEIRGWLLIDE